MEMLRKSTLFLFLMLAVGMVGFTSCSDDDSAEEEAIASGIVGTWQTTYVTLWTTVDGVDDGESFDGPMSFIGLNFTEDGQVTIAGIDGFSGTYRISGDKLVLTTEDGIIEMDITELSDDRLVLEYSYSETVYGEHWEGYMKLECQRLA